MFSDFCGSSAVFNWALSLGHRTVQRTFVFAEDSCARNQSSVAPKTAPVQINTAIPVHLGSHIGQENTAGFSGRSIQFEVFSLHARIKAQPRTKAITKAPAGS